MVSQRDIARKASVSVMTVSRVLRGDRYVSNQLTKRVLKVAEELGYRPDPLIQTLMNQRANRRKSSEGMVVAWLGLGGFLWDKGEKMGPLHAFNRYFQGASEALEKRGFGIFECLFENGTLEIIEPSRIESILRSRGIPGILMGPVAHSFDIPIIKTDDFSFIQIGRSRENANLDVVAADHFHAMRVCLVKLKEYGYTRIGYFDDYSHNVRSEKLWEAAFLLDYIESGIPPYLSKKQTDFSKKALLEYVENYQLDAVVSGRPCIYEWIHTENAFSGLGFACINGNGEEGNLPGVAVTFEDIGARAANVLVDKILSGKRGLSSEPVTISIRGRWRGEISRKSE